MAQYMWNLKFKKKSKKIIHDQIIFVAIVLISSGFIFYAPLKGRFFYYWSGRDDPGVMIRAWWSGTTDPGLLIRAWWSGTTDPGVMIRDYWSGRWDGRAVVGVMIYKKVIHSLMINGTCKRYRFVIYWSCYSKSNSAERLSSYNKKTIATKKWKRTF